ncbi:MAG: hypothetical protein II857_00225 [Selenomonadaceae bacterium]|nr:hypothetical protein [Selenomonadaceae bacterium]
MLKNKIIFRNKKAGGEIFRLNFLLGFYVRAFNIARPFDSDSLATAEFAERKKLGKLKAADLTPRAEE